MLKVKVFNLWKMLGGHRVKVSSNWKSVKQTFQRKNGTWIKGYDNAPVLRLSTRSTKTSTDTTAYYYELIWQGSILIEVGDTLECELSSDTPHAGIDIMDNIPTTWRGEGILDQNGTSMHPNSFNPRITQGWYRRVFNLNKKVGVTITSMAMAFEDRTNSPQGKDYTLSIRNVLLRRANGTIKYDFIKGGALVLTPTIWSGANAIKYTLLSKTLIPEKL